MGPWVNIGDPMHGLKNPWVFPGDAQLFLGVLTYVGDLWNKYDKWVKINNFLGTPVLFYLSYLLTSSDILSGISSDIFWHSFWHSIWHIFWHSIWHIFWHSISFYLAYLLTFFLALYLAYLLTFYLAYLLTFYLAYLLTFYLAYLLISFYILSGTLPRAMK